MSVFFFTKTYFIWIFPVFFFPFFHTQYQHSPFSSNFLSSLISFHTFSCIRYDIRIQYGRTFVCLLFRIKRKREEGEEMWRKWRQNEKPKWKWREISSDLANTKAGNSTNTLSPTTGIETILSAVFAQKMLQLFLA